MRGFYLALVILLSTVNLVSGKYVSGRIDNGNWMLVSRFSFVDDVGQLDYKVEYTVTNKCCPSLAYYNDDSWESVRHNSNMDCQSKVSYAQGLFTFQTTNGINKSSSGNYSVQCSTNNDTQLRQCSGTLRLQSVNVRWWSFVLSHCNSAQRLNISYEFNFTNGDFWYMDVSAKEDHILENHVISFGGFLLLFATSLYFARQLRRRGLVHRAFKLFMATLGFKKGATLLDTIYHTHYVLSGVKLPLLTFGEMLHATSEICLIVLLVLLAFGWTITKSHLRESTQAKLNKFFSIYILVFGILFVLDQEFFETGEPSQFAKILRIARLGNLALRALAWVIFVFGAITTIQTYPEKRIFFLSFMGFYSVWFLSRPFTFLVSYFFLDEWQNAQIYHRLDSLLCFLAFGGLLFIMKPSRANVNFPFHARLNEVDPSPEQNPLARF